MRPSLRPVRGELLKLMALLGLIACHSARSRHPLSSFGRHDHSANGAWRCHGRISEVTRRWASDRGHDSVAATDMNQSLMSWSLPPDRVAVLVSPSELGVD